MSKKIVLAYLCAFVLLFIAPVLIFEVFGAHFDQENFEQRAKAEKPEFSLNTIAEYPQAFETYYDDNLPFRSQLIEANNLIDFYLFRQSPVSKVVIGQDDWLFYDPSEADGNPMSNYRGEKLYSDEQLAQLAATLVATRNTLAAQGKEFIIFIAPNKVCIYGPDYLPEEYGDVAAVTTADQVVDYLSKNTDLQIVYPKDSLLTYEETFPAYDFYFKTDTHWNHLGGYIGAQALMEAAGITAPRLEELQIKEGDNTSGDLAGMMGLSKYLCYDRTYILDGYAPTNNGITATYPTEGNSDLILYSTEGADVRSLFVVRDSFSLHMMPYLSTQFNHSCFVNFGIYTPDLLAQYPSDIVVLEVVERYIDRLFNFVVN